MKNHKKHITILTHFVLIFLSVLFIFPFLWMLDTAIKPIAETMTTTPKWIPSHFEFDNFWKAITYGSDKLGYIPFLVYAENTLMLAALVVIGTVVSNSIVAYSFARLRWWGRDVIFAITLATMMVPFPVLMVPTFTIFKHLDWIGTYRPLWVPAWFGSAFSIFLLRQFFKTIPFELSEAARIDGAGEWKIFRSIILPLSKPALSVVALFALMGTWNDFLGPLIYLLRQETFTLSLGLEFYHSHAGGTIWNLLMAATSIVVVPVLILFFFCQKQFIKGISITGIK
ncbi:MAG: ABC transporter permease subunit [Armatimonadetes bacterium]|nr:ABC transporter permease subunit [Armatimonadota bacterium]MBS1728224.1 carbohydrate ABC transporter permease [Armatimonadota bacterium]